MKLSESASKSLDYVRPKVIRKDYDFNQIEKLAVAEVWEEIQYNVSGKKRVLSLGCQSCLADASNILLNFINMHEERDTPKTARVFEIKIDEELKEETVVRDVTLAELRAQYPHIKATSVKVFLQKIENEKAL